MLLLSSADFFSKLTFSKSSFRVTTRVIRLKENNLIIKEYTCIYLTLPLLVCHYQCQTDSDGPDLGPNCLQRSSADNESLQICTVLSVPFCSYVQSMKAEEAYDH